MTDDTERRRFSRIDLDAQVVLHQGNRSQQAQLLDISLKGLLVRPEDPAALSGHETVKAEVYLTEAFHFAMDCELAHRRNDLVGLSCHNMDLEGVMHLRRMLELNLADPDAAERELGELMPGDEQP